MTDLQNVGEIVVAAVTGNTIGTLIGQLIDHWRKRRKSRVPLERIDNLDPTRWRPVPWVEFTEEMPIEEARRRFPMVICTCRFQVTQISQVPDFIHAVTTDSECPMHGDKPCPPSK